MTEHLNEYMQKMETGIPGFISVSLVNANDGTILAYKAKDNKDNSLASSFQSELFKNAIRSFENTEGLNDKNVTDISIVYKNQIHITSISDSRKFLVHLIIDNTTNLVLAKMIMVKLREEYSSKLHDIFF